MEVCCMPNNKIVWKHAKPNIAGVPSVRPITWCSQVDSNGSQVTVQHEAPRLINGVVIARGKVERWAV